MPTPKSRWYLNVKKRRTRVKIAAVMYKGGKCQRCGYSKSIAALEFHHKDESKKAFAISGATHNKSWEDLKKELDKCELICSNCHQENHMKRDAAFIADCLDYNGQNPEIKELLDEYKAFTQYQNGNGSACKAVVYRFESGLGVQYAALAQ